MEAIAKTEPVSDSLDIVEVDRPTVDDPDDVLVEIEAGGICGTDVGIYRWQGSGYEWIDLPRIVGHEVAGTVVEAGADAGGLVGQRVTLNPQRGCGRCSRCRDGQPEFCEEFGFYGAHWDGGFAPYFVCPAEQVVRLPADVSATEGAVVEPLSVAKYAVSHNAGIASGETVLVQGPGPIGLFVAEMSRLAGADPVIVAGIADDSTHRLPLAADLGHVPVDVEADDVVDVVDAETSTGRVDAVIDCTGSPKAITDGIRVVKKGGQITVVGTPHDPSEVDLSTIVQRGVTIQGSYGFTYGTFRTVTRMLARNRILTETMVSTGYKLDDVTAICGRMVEKEIVKGIVSL